MNGPLLSYVTAHRWFVACLTVLAVLCALNWLYGWLERRALRKAPEWCQRELAARGIHIDVPPWNDPRDSQRRDEEFRRQQPSRFH